MKSNTKNGFIRSAVLYGPHDFRIEEVPAPKSADDEYLIRVKACGVCHSELHQWEVKQKDIKYPRRIGHEVSGEIIARGSGVRKYNLGDRVALWVDSSGYSEQVTAKEERVFPIQKEVPFYEALAEPISCTVNGVIKAELQLGETVALVGTGFMGLILLQEIKLRGPKLIIAIDVRDEMLKLAKKLGADVVINSAKEDPVKKIKKLTGDKGVDVSFEIGGIQATLDLAPEITRMEGKLVIFGYHPGSRKIKDLGFWNWMAFDIINAHFRNMDTILNGTRVGMDLLNDGKINMAPLVTHKYPLEKIEEAFKAAREKPKGFVKSVIVFN